MDNLERNSGLVFGLERRYWSIFGLLFFGVLYLWDIGNILAPRQGTESLYVQISKEMFESKSFITPLYRGEPHWSKPPLQYWIPMPLYALFGGFSLTLARLSMALTSFGTVGLLLYFLRRQKFNLSWTKTAIIFLASFGIFKFSRIFMMEVPLSLLPLIGAISFYDYINSKNNLSLIISIVFIGLGGLVKGPVSLAMGFTSIWVYWFYELKVQRRQILKEVLIVTSLSSAVSSIWYLICFDRYGMEFINYFFLRENMGKFGQSSSMSPLKIFQGLIIYTFPWLHLISFRPKNIITQLKKPFFVFLFIHFLIFFFIWFIPSQKSHHYAMPGFVFWLTILLINPRVFIRDRVSRFFFWAQICIILLFAAIFLYFSATVSELALALIPIIVILFSVNFKASSYGIGISFVALMTVLITRFYLPLIPQGQIETILRKTDKTIFYNDRRPFFLEQRLDRKIELFEQKKLSKGDYIIGPHSKSFMLPLSKLERVASWPKWKRKVRGENVLNALKNRDLRFLKGKYILYRFK